jgi:hypothetical protein
LRSLGLGIGIIISDGEKTSQNLDQPDILKGVGTAIEFEVPRYVFTTQQPEAIAPT